jgi:hypothetical protein
MVDIADLTAGAAGQHAGETQNHDQNPHRLSSPPSRS